MAISASYSEFLADLPTILSTKKDTDRDRDTSVPARCEPQTFLETWRDIGKGRGCSVMRGVQGLSDEGGRDGLAARRRAWALPTRRDSQVEDLFGDRVGDRGRISPWCEPEQEHDAFRRTNERTNEQTNEVGSVGRTCSLAAGDLRDESR